LTNEGAGQPATGNATDVAGNTSSASATVNIDKTPPTITASAMPAPNAAGWNNTSVNVAFSCSDALSGVATCPAAAIVGTEGANQNIPGTATDKAGNTASTSVLLNIDKTPPAIMATASPGANSAGWNKSDVTVSFQCSDSGSGVATCPSDQVVSSEGANQIVSGTATDVAGNSASASATINLDKTPPVIGIASPANNSVSSTSTLAVSGTATDALSGIANATCNGTAAVFQGSSFSCSVSLGSGSNTIVIVATDVAGNSSSQSLTVSMGPAIADFNPKSASAGTVISVSGSGLTAGSGVPQVVLTGGNGGTIPAPIAGFTATGITFVVPDGAGSGPLTITVGTQTVVSTATLNIIASSDFSLTIGPQSASVIQGQSANFAVTLNSSNGFNQLAALTLSGLPSGLTAAFHPQQITSAQTALLTITAPVGQSVGSANLTISASATVNGIPLTQSATATLNIQSIATSFLGRTSKDDALQTPLAGVTISFLGVDGMGGKTGCSGQTQSDDAGNFSFTNLGTNCSGEQLVRYDGSTAATAQDKKTGTSVKYAGVDLLYNIVTHQVTTPPNVIRLPRIDDKETVFVQQNSSQDQTFTFKTIPHLSVIVYAGTTFTLADGSHPDPFPLIAVDVPVDRLPDEMPSGGSTINPFIVAFQPANAVASQPVAVFFPNTINTPPGTVMELNTLNPTIGMMVRYGSGSVSRDGTQIIPDPDPAHPNHLFGLVHFDWHGPSPPPPPQQNPGPPGGGSGSGGGAAGGPGAGPGGSSGPGGGNGGGGNGGGPGGGPGGGGPGGGGPGGDGPGGGGPGGGGPGRGGPGGGGPGGGGPGGGGPGGGGPGGGGPGGGCITCSCTSLLSPVLDPRSTQGIDQLGLDSEYAAQAGDPVDLFSGVQVINATDISVYGARGTISIVRSYRSLTNHAGPFGIGTNHNYGYALNTAFPQSAANINLVMPDGNRFPFAKQPDGTLTNTTIPRFIGAVMTVQPDNSVDLRWKNGTVWHFVPISFQIGSLLASIADANGNTIGLTRNPSDPNQLTQVTDPVGRSLTLIYDPADRITTIVDPIGRTVQYTYNSQGTLATVTDPAGGVTKYDYDSQNRLVKITDARGTIQAQNTLDANGRVIQQLRPDGGTLKFSYAPLNSNAPTSPIMFTRVTDNLGVSAGYRFNPQGFVTDIVATQSQMRSIKRASETNQVLSVTEANSKQSLTYDSSGNLLSSTDALGNTTAFTYELAFNKLTSAVDPLGNATHFTYDPHGNLLTRNDANGHTTSFAYNSFGQVTEVTDPAGQKTTLAYDSFGNLISTSDPLGNTTSIAYDAISRPVQAIDALGRRSQTIYDALSRVTQQVNPQGNSTRFTYDPVGNILSVTDANEHSTSFTYDSLNRLLTTTDPLGNTDTRSYDTNGNLIQFLDRRGQASTFTYDNVNQLLEADYKDSTVIRSYDAFGRLVHVNDSAGGDFDFAYDAAGRLLSSTNRTGTVQYTYDAASRTISRQVIGQPVLQYKYDSVGNLLSAVLPQASASFSYDARDQLITIDRANHVASLYQYDSAGGLLSLIHSGSADTLNAQTYTYDAVGNRTSYITNLGQPLATPATTSSTFDAANRLLRKDLTAFTYDANGNLTSAMDSSGTSTLVWDARNRLRSIIGPGVQASFQYDFVGNLMSQSVNGRSRTYVIDDLTNIAALNDNGDLEQVLSGRTIDQHLALSYFGGEVEYVLTDAMNSTIATSDHLGKEAGLFLYEPFGQTTSTETNFPLQFTGRLSILDHLYYYRSRFYDSTINRFISEDSLQFGGGVNFYAYVGNNAINRTDPNGQAFIDCLKALQELIAATANVEDRIADIIANGSNPDCGHKQALEEATNRLNNALDKVKKHCSFYAGAAAAIAAGLAVLEEAAPFLLAAV
jgi:RHS repeat-associated protein